MQTIPFYRPSIGQEEINEVVDTLKGGWLTTGPRAQRFEAEFSKYTGCIHSVALNSCTAALHLALEAIGLKAGDAVLLPTMTFAATAEVVRYFNAVPILVDCREGDFTIDIEDATAKTKRAVSHGAKVKAIIPVHYGGQIADMAAVKQLASAYHLKVIEDAAHCCPAYYRDAASSKWKMVGTEADISCFSFYANKTITTGEGGMACTNNSEYADRMRIMSLHGISRNAWKRFTAQGSWFYEIIAPGFKYNLTDVAAAIGLHQLRKADKLHQKRTSIAETYTRELQGIDEIILPQTQPNRIHSWHLYVIRLQLKSLDADRAQIIEELKSAGIGTSVHWMPLHMHPYYRELFGYLPEDLPVAAKLYKEIISLPIYPDMTEADVIFVSTKLKEILRKYHKPHKGARSVAASAARCAISPA